MYTGIVTGTPPSIGSILSTVELPEYVSAPTSLPVRSLPKLGVAGFTSTALVVTLHESL